MTSYVSLHADRHQTSEHYDACIAVSTSLLSALQAQHFIITADTLGTLNTVKV